MTERTELPAEILQQRDKLLHYLAQEKHFTAQEQHWAAQRQITNWVGRGLVAAIIFNSLPRIYEAYVAGLPIVGG